VSETDETEVFPVKMTPKSLSEIILFFLIAFQNTAAKPKPKSNPEADPKAWDWQNEPHNQLPVFSPYQEVKYQAHDHPSFLKINRNITVKLGETAYLPCRVKNLHKYTVSWIRSSDVSVLSVGHLAFSSDSRIGVVQVDRPVLSASDWNLSILNSSKADDGMYECQVNTEPKINYKVFLSVQDPADALQKDSPYYEIEPVSKNGKKGSDYEKTHSLVKKHHITQIEKEGFSMYLHDNGCICPKPQIVTRDRHGHRTRDSPEMTVTGGPIHYFSEGDQLSLECVMTGLTTPPVSLHWTRGSGHDNISPRERDGVSLETERAAGTSRSNLFLRHVELSDTGNYTCVSDSTARTVLVVVTGHGSSQSRIQYVKSAPTPRSDGSTSSVHLMLLVSTLVVSQILNVNINDQ